MAIRPLDRDGLDPADRARAEFIGAKAGYYLAARHGRAFNFAAMCAGPAWLMYRRMPVAAALHCAAIYALAMVLPELVALSLLAPIALGFLANRHYLAHVDAVLRDHPTARDGTWGAGAAIGAVMALTIIGVVAATLTGATLDPESLTPFLPGQASAPLTLFQRAAMLLVTIAPGLCLIAILTLRFAAREWLAPALAGGLIATFGTYPPIMLALILVGGGRLLADDAPWAMATLGSGVPEEAAKLAALIVVVLPTLRWRPGPAMIVAISGLIGTAFGVLENLAYVMGGGEWAATALVRAIWSVPFHGFNGVIMGALVVVALARGDRRRLIIAWAVPALLHAAFNYPLFVVEQRAPQLPIMAAELIFLGSVTAIAIGAAWVRALALADPALDGAGSRDHALSRWLRAAALATCTLPLVLALSPGGLRLAWTSTADGIGMIMLAAACVAPFAMAAALWDAARTKT